MADTYTPGLVSIGTDTKGRDAQLDARAAALWRVTVPLVRARLGIDLSSRILQALGAAAALATLDVFDEIVLRGRPIAPRWPSGSPWGRRRVPIRVRRTARRRCW